ncbi:hypothetical protein [Pseudoclavibacter sp. 13-3]|uniref:hypothetical protein n=1 Tax=Pseudoclavibacter sp. 13-3 TaxID=2901228 RepID=UPI001E4CF9C8|nr:hypothetical protein [Pseudoclavibacter sp. 13-3]MCD7101133.1 hypothetical protein [Pseudoclavibacter sp. 13-3]
MTTLCTLITRSRQHRASSERGLTLAELLIAGAIAAVVISLVAGLWITTSVMQRNTTSIALRTQQLDAFNSQFRSTTANAVYAGHVSSASSDADDDFGAVQAISVITADDPSDLSHSPVTCTAWLWWGGVEGRSDDDDASNPSGAATSGSAGVYLRQWQLGTPVTLPAAGQGLDTSWSRVVSAARPVASGGTGTPEANLVFNTAPASFDQNTQLVAQGQPPVKVTMLTADFTAAPLQSTSGAAATDALRVSTQSLMSLAFSSSDPAITSLQNRVVNDNGATCLTGGRY